jgi:hypothetical protein
MLLLIGLLALAVAVVDSSSRGTMHRISWGPSVSAYSITVAQGDVVTWVLDQGPSSYSLVSSSISSALGFPFGGNLHTGDSYELHVTLPLGIYVFVCQESSKTMWGSLTVVAASVDKGLVQSECSILINLYRSVS